MVSPVYVLRYDIRRRWFLLLEALDAHGPGAPDELPFARLDECELARDPDGTWALLDLAASTTQHPEAARAFVASVRKAWPDRDRLTGPR